MVEIASVYSSSYVSPFQPSDPDNEKKRRTGGRTSRTNCLSRDLTIDPSFTRTGINSDPWVEDVRTRAEDGGWVLELEGVLIVVGVELCFGSCHSLCSLLLFRCDLS